MPASVESSWAADTARGNFLTAEERPRSGDTGCEDPEHWRQSPVLMSGGGPPSCHKRHRIWQGVPGVHYYDNNKATMAMGLET